MRTFYDYEATRRVLLNDPCIMVGHNWQFSHYAKGSEGLVTVMECLICGGQKKEETWASTYYTTESEAGDV